MATALAPNPYGPHNLTYIAHPQAPPSPPVEEIPRCSLPSISSLLGIADNGQPQEQIQQQSQVQTVDYRQQSQYIPQPNATVKTNLPLTPPMQSDSGFEGRQSPTSASTSTYSVISASSSYYSTSGSAINNVDPHMQRQSIPRRVSMPYSQQSHFSMSPFSISPSQQSMSSCYSSPMQLTPPPHQSQISGLYYQRPLPQNFSPSMPISLTIGGNPWQHHHYISPSSQAAFPQTQDRYICQTCNKAFSRPSSLRIHSHSHTGEKPFKCAHAGCGKAFSVRSNMKRHERGCHTFEGRM